MIKSDPIIAVKDVEVSSRWYRSLLGCRSRHGGNHFDILTNENDEVLICLHRWGDDNHPTMIDRRITPGNGLILYFRTENLPEIRNNAENMGVPVEEDIHMNPNSGRKEFSVRDPDGYYLTITELHNYEG